MTGMYFTSEDSVELLQTVDRQASSLWFID